jgi:hypothetical protein
MKYYFYPYQQAAVNGLYLIAKNKKEAESKALKNGFNVNVDCGLTTEQPNNHGFTFHQIKRLTNNFTK